MFNRTKSAADKLAEAVRESIHRSPFPHGSMIHTALIAPLEVALRGYLEAVVQPICVLAIETRHPEDYEGPRVTAHYTRAQALADAADWLSHAGNTAVQASLEQGRFEAALDLAIEQGVIHGWGIHEFDLARLPSGDNVVTNPNTPGLRGISE